MHFGMGKTAKPEKSQKKDALRHGKAAKPEKNWKKDALWHGKNG